ncbi:helix-turn-helix transcriptional regulator [Prescottella subtropica]|uniref:helix-turn-helix transcriptional regulator n=1 Tax=Prescottella subtropica TaxID=2545757 RepID=UPI0010F9C280|nr:helix-turn-helix transcriptional regulator [Prescottella subtropica]
MRGFQPEKLEKARRAAGISQAELGRIVRIKGETVRRWEQGGSSPQVDLLARAVEAIGVAIADVVHVPEDERFPGDWRVLRGLTQPLLGAAAGVTTQLVGSVERGEITLSDNLAKKLAAALDISESELRASHERARNRPAGTSA